MGGLGLAESVVAMVDGPMSSRPADAFTSLAPPGIGTCFGHVAPLSVLCQRFWLLLAYTLPLALGSVATAAR